MERINNLIELNRQPQKSSPTAPTIEMSNDEFRVLGEVIDRWRLNLGWTPLDNASLRMAANSWFSVLSSENIPFQVYHELYERALKTRAARISQGKEVSAQFGVELLLAEWIGENGLCREMEKRRVNAGRTLSANAQTVCQHCHGSGFKRILQDGYWGAVKCNHED